MKENKLKQNSFDKRNFYVIKDSGLVFLFAIVFMLAASLLFMYVAMFCAKGSGVQFPQDKGVFDVLLGAYPWLGAVYALVAPLSFFSLYFVYHKVQKISFSATKISVKKANPITALLCAFVGIICVLGFVWLIEGCFGALFDKLKVANDGVNIPLNNAGWLILNLLVLGVLPALAEELIFRGVIFKALQEKFSSVAAIMLSSAAFALMHQNIMQLIYPFILGSLLAFVMFKTNNLLYCMIIHMFNNFTTIIISYLQNIGVISLDFPLQWWGVLAAIAVAAATCAILWLVYILWNKKIAKQPKNQENLPEDLKTETEENFGQVKGNAPTMLGKFPFSLVLSFVACVVLLVISLV